MNVKNVDVLVIGAGPAGLAAAQAAKADGIDSLWTPIDALPLDN